MAHRNRCFTELKNGDVPWQTVSHNQMVTIKSPKTPKTKKTSGRLRHLGRDGCGYLDEIDSGWLGAKSLHFDWKMEIEIRKIDGISINP
jgi:hypothetical protein